jgi:glycosyltransferase involved in cell wall biosynthesis
MQGLLEWYSQHVYFNAIERVELRLEPISLRRASVITTESSFAVEWLHEHYPHLEIHQAEHAPNWLFHRLERQPQVKPLRFLYVGSISPVKGTDLLLGALDKLKSELDFELTIVGSGSPKFFNELKTRTSPALWERVHVRHGLSQEQVGEELKQATMVLFPTRVDTSPNSVKEAVVAGVPVVASAIGGIIDYVVPDKNGILFPAGDGEAFAKSVRAAVAHPLFGQGKVSQEALAGLRNYLSPAVMSEKFRAAYGSVLTKAQRGTSEIRA